MTTRVLLTAHQLEHHGHRYRAAAPGAELQAMAPDGTITHDGRTVAWEDAACDVAFGSTDLFDGDPGDRAIRRFFGWALRSDALRWFHVAAAGVDDEVFGRLLDRGVRLTTSHHTAVPISEYVLAQVLRARLRLDDMEAHRRERRWRGVEWDEVASSRWLVVGLGAIGSEVAHRARAFGAHVSGVRRSPTGAEPVDRVLAADDLLGALAEHDVVVLALPATAATAGLVDRRFLDALAPGTVLVNVGRGQLVDEDALLVGLGRGVPAVAVLDVARREPPPEDHWLWEHPSVVLTSHTSAGGRGRHERAAEAFAANLGRWAAGQPLADEVTAATREPPPGPAPRQAD